MGKRKIFARIFADVGKMWGKLRNRKIAKVFNFKALAIIFGSNSYPEPNYLDSYLLYLDYFISP